MGTDNDPLAPTGPTSTTSSLDLPVTMGRSYSPVAETLFRKDLISAMKLPDNEPLTSDDYWVVTDTWKQEWEKGVQVPVKPEELPEPHVSKVQVPPQSANRFQFPRKLISMSRNSDTHQVSFV